MQLLGLQGKRKEETSGRQRDGRYWIVNGCIQTAEGTCHRSDRRAAVVAGHAQESVCTHVRDIVGSSPWCVCGFTHRHRHARPHEQAQAEIGDFITQHMQKPTEASRG